MSQEKLYQRLGIPPKASLQEAMEHLEKSQDPQVRAQAKSILKQLQELPCQAPTTPTEAATAAQAQRI